MKRIVSYQSNYADIIQRSDNYVITNNNRSDTSVTKENLSQDEGLSFTFFIVYRQNN